MSILNPLYELVSGIIVLWHAVFGAVFGRDSGASWALSIVFLTISMRLLLFPLFVKQIRSQRAMQALAPRIKELQKRHKGDRETLNRETMALYKEHNANPIAGCLPLLLQLPIFFALFHVLNRIKPGADGSYEAVFRLSTGQVDAAAHATIFGAPIAAAFSSSSDLISTLGGSQSATKVLAVVMIVLMGLSTFITQKQMMARATTTDPQQQRIQRFMLYVLPFSFAIFGFNFPLGVLLYWLTTNLWSMGQQYVVLRRMPMSPAGAGTSGPAAAAAATGRGTAEARPGLLGRARSRSHDRSTAGSATRDASSTTPSERADGPAPGTVAAAGSASTAGATDIAGTSNAAGSTSGGTARAVKGKQAGSRKNRKKRPGGRR